MDKVSKGRVKVCELGLGELGKDKLLDLLARINLTFSSS